MLIEAEGQLGHHTTGRSAALFSETYGNHAVRSLTVASRSFFERPPEGFDRPLLTRRGGGDDAFLAALSPMRFR